LLIFLASANFDGADFKNAVLDRVIFSNSSMKGASFVNAGAPPCPEPCCSSRSLTVHARSHHGQSV